MEQSESHPEDLLPSPIVKVIASPAYRIPTRREFHLINLSDKAVVDVYLLSAVAIRAFYGFVYHDFLNQGVKSSVVSSVGLAYCLISSTHFPASLSVCSMELKASCNSRILVSSSCCSV